MKFDLVTRLLTFIVFAFSTLGLSSQKTFYGEDPVNWNNYPAPKLPADPDRYSSSDLVIINDETKFSFYSSNNETVIRNITFKVNTEKGLDLLKVYRLPESFDPAFDANYHQQGRAARIKTPFISEFSIRKFAARKLSGNRLSDVPFQLKYETIKWIRSSGEDVGGFINEDLSAIHLQGLAVGDIVQVVYEAEFNANYGNNVFYFHSAFPKLHCQYTFAYKVEKENSEYSFVLPINVQDTSIRKSTESSKTYAIHEKKIDLYNLNGINYPANNFQGKSLPSVFADFRFYRKLTGSYPSDGGRVYDFEFFRPRNFEWVIFTDTVNNYSKIYDKQFAAIRKFMTKMPAYSEADSLNKIFFKALCDTFNSFRYISSNHLYYNESNLGDIYSGEHILKRRLVEKSQWKLYKDILNNSKVFYSIVNVQDKRFGEHTPLYRASYGYETELIAIPSNGSYIYFMPRYDGMKYHLNELPFYFEGSLALLSPRNFQDNVKNKNDQFFKFIRTHRGTSNENTRTENASVRIALDSLKADLTIKESLSGQFSTVLRHLYLNDYIDSTISKHYFKKCVDKPFTSNTKIRLSSKMTEFPFRYNFQCTECLGMAGDKHLRLTNWFSFTLSKTNLPEKPQHDYYFDFDFTDTYNFMLNFKEAVELKNAAQFNRKINNDYFELDSEITSSSETSYFMKVKLIVKKTMIPLEKTELLIELVKELDALNNFSLELAKK